MIFGHTLFSQSSIFLKLAQKMALEQAKQIIYNLQTALDAWSNKFGPLPPAMSNSATVISKSYGLNNFTPDTLNQVHGAAQQLGTSQNLGNLSPEARTAWMEQVYPPAIKVQFLEWANLDQSTPTPGDNVIEVPETIIGKNEPVVNKSQTTLAQTAINYAKFLEGAIKTLPTAEPARSTKLKQLNQTTQYLKNLYRTFQNRGNSNLQEEFAKMTISNVLNEVYNQLNYNDLDQHLTALKSDTSFSGGIPG